MAQLRHPNLVRILALPGGAGLAPASGQGQRLSDFTPAGTFKRFELVQVVGLLLDVLSGLAALHEVVEDGRAFVHGEVSPQHIYVSDDGTARLVPVLARHLQPRAKPVANGYTAPEILLGDPGDPRADLFSVGVMLWEALAGTPLFPDPSLDAVIPRLVGGKIAAVRPPAASRWAQPLCAIAECAIAVDPQLRFQTATELSNALGIAIAPHLARRERSAWQDEAPTLLQQRPHLRRLTPPATVIDLEPEAPRATERALLAQAAPALERTARAQWRGRALAWGAASAALLALLLRQPVKAPQPAARAATPSAAVAPTAAVAQSATAPAPSVSAVPSPAAAPSTAPSASVLVPAVTTPASPANPRHSRHHDRATESSDSDYGI